MRFKAFGQSLVITSISQEALENCEAEVEISTISGQILIQFLQDELIAAISK